MAAREPTAGASAADAPPDAGDRKPGEVTCTFTRETDGSVALAPTAAPARDAAEPLPLPALDGQVYEVLGEIGQGGLGRVFQARDRRLERVVALKELHQLDESSRARLVNEARITARLEHPAIVPVYEAGRWSNGVPFYAMKLIAGRTLKEAVAACTTLTARLSLLPAVVAIADAVAYAHSKRIVHGDLKPANVILGEYGETVIIDWGLAQDLSGGPAAPRAVAGTPGYMAPEQARGEAVDERADVFALGAILYVVLTGTRPYEGGDSRSVLEAVRRGPPVEVSLREPGAPVELATIVAKSMARERADRYPSARELSEDLRRFQTGQLVLAHRYDRRTLLLRWLRRRRVPLAVTTFVLLALAAIGAVSITRIVRERERAEARANELLLTQARAEVGHDPTGAVALLKSYPDDGADWAGVREIAKDAESRGVASRVLRGHTAMLAYAVFSPDGRTLASSAQDRSVILWDVASGAPTARFDALDGTRVTFSGDGRWLAHVGAGHQAIVHDLVNSTDRKLDILPADGDALLFANQGHRLAVWSADGRVALFDPAENTTSTLLPPDGHPVLALTFSADDERIAAAGSDGSLRLADVRGGAPRVVYRGARPLDDVALSSDGALAAVLAEGGAVSVIDLGSGAVTVVEPELSSNRENYFGALVSSPGPTPVGPFALGRNGYVLAFGAQGIAARYEHPDTKFLAVAYSPDGRFLAFAGDGDSTRIEDLERGTGEPLLHDAPGTSTVVFSPDGRTLATASMDQTIRLWPVAPRTSHAFSPGVRAPLSLHHALGGRAIVAGSDQGPLVLAPWSGESPQILDQDPARTARIDVSPDGLRAVSCNLAGRVREWDLVARVARELDGFEGRCLDVAYSPDGDWIASGGDGNLVRLERSEARPGTARDTIRLTGPDSPVWSVRYSPDGQSVAAGTEDGDVWLWDLATRVGRRVCSVGGIGYLVRFSPAGDALAILGTESGVKVWHREDGRTEEILPAVHGLYDFVYSAGGRYIAVGYADGAVRVWDTRLRVTKVFHGAPIPSRLLFSIDETMLATGSKEGTIRLWDVASGDSRILRGHADIVSSLLFSTDGQSLASASGDGTIHVWNLAEYPLAPRGRDAVRAWLLRLTTEVSGRGAAPP